MLRRVIQENAQTSGLRYEVESVRKKFTIGQVVVVINSENPVPWYGKVEWELDGVVEVAFSDQDILQYTIGELRPLNRKEIGR